MKNLLIALLSIGTLGNIANAQNVLVNAPLPYPQNTMGDTGLQIYYAGNSTGTPSAGPHSINTVQGFRFINTSAGTNSRAENLIYLDVSTTANLNGPFDSQIGVTLTTDGAGTEVPLLGASIAERSSAPAPCNAGSCFSSSKAAIYVPGTVLRLAFSLDDLCASNGNAGSLCAANAYQTLLGSTLVVSTLKVNFGVVKTTTTDASAVTTAPINASTVFTFGITDVSPTVATSCPAGKDAYSVADQRIYLNTAAFKPDTGVNGVSLSALLVMANQGDAPNAETGGLNSEIVAYLDPMSASGKVSGFTNNKYYNVVVQSQNIAGLISPSGSECVLINVQTKKD